MLSFRDAVANLGRSIASEWRHVERLWAIKSVAKTNCPEALDSPIGEVGIVGGRSGKIGIVPRRLDFDGHDSYKLCVAGSRWTG